MVRMDELERREGELGPAGPHVGLPATAGESARRDMAGVLSAIVPGVGHLVLHARLRAAVWFSLAVLASFLWWGLRLPHVLTGLALAVAVNALIWIFAGIDGLFGMRARLPRPHPAWLLIVLPMGFFSAVLADNLLLRASGFAPVRVPSDAMANTVRGGEQVLMDTRAFRAEPPKPGDIVVFERQGQKFVRRVIATGETTVAGQNGAILVNGAQLPETYAHHTTLRQNIDNFPAVTVPQGEYFVAGDDRDTSLDSRMPDFGLVTDQAIVGRPLYILSGGPLRIGRAVR